MGGTTRRAGATAVGCPKAVRPTLSGALEGPTLLQAERPARIATRRRSGMRRGRTVGKAGDEKQSENQTATQGVSQAVGLAVGR